MSTPELTCTCLPHFPLAIMQKLEYNSSIKGDEPELNAIIVFWHITYHRD
jgi:hypothetical protein